MTRHDFMALVLHATEDTIDMLECTLRKDLPVDGSDHSANTVLFASDQLYFALVRYRAEHQIPKR